MSKQFIQTLTKQQLKLFSNKKLCVIADSDFGEQTKMARRILCEGFFGTNRKD